MDRKSFEEGIILALVSPPIPHVVKREPIAYSYNGVILPKLPEWDREKYPYAVIGLLDGVYYFTYHYTTYAVYENGTYYVSPSAMFAYALTDGEWESTTLIKSLTAVWSNYDMQTTDGTLVLSASDPIPVYE